MFNFSGGTNIGTASARVEVDLSQPRQAVGQMRTIAQQITDSLNSINRRTTSNTGVPNQFGVVTALNRQMQEEAKAAQKLARQRSQMIEDTRPKTIPELDSFARNLTANRFGVVPALDKEMQAEGQAAQRLARQREAALRDIARRTPQANAFGVITALDPNLQQIGQNAQRIEQQRLQQAQANERQYRTQMQNEIRQTNAILSRARSELSAEQQRFNVASVNAPAGVDRRDALTSLASQRQRIAEVQAEFARLRQTIASLPPAEQIKYAPQLREIQQQAQLAARGIDQTANAINRFSSSVQASRSGIQGYFTQVRENLERINETSLAANLQEISFRLLPLGLAMGALARRGIQTAESFQEINLSFSAFTGSEQTATQLMEQLTQQAHRFGLPMVQTLEVMQRFAPLIRQAGLSLEDTINIAARLATLNPTQGIEGALYAINEALAGQWRSLQFRFNIPTENLRNLIQEQGFIGGLDTFLNQLGRTTEFAEKFGTTARAAFTRLTDSVNNFLAVAVEPVLSFFAGIAESVTNFFNTIADNAPLLANFAGTFLVLGTALSGGLILFGQLALAINAVRALMPGYTANVIANTAAITANTIANNANAASQGAVAAAENIVNAAFNANTGARGLRSLAATAGRGAAAGAVVLGGVAIGTNVAAGLGIPGIDNPADAIQRLVQIITIPVLGLSFIIELFKDTLENGANVIGSVLHNIGVIISAGANLIGDVLQHLGAVISKAIGTIEGTIGNLLVGIADQFKDVFDTSGIRAAGEATLLSADRKILNADRILADPILDFYDRVHDQLINISNLPFLPTDEQLQQAHDNASRRWVEANNTISAILGFLGFPTAQVSLPSNQSGDQGPGLTPDAGGTSGLGEDELSRAYDLLVNNMIQTTRRAADEAIAAEREIEDFAINRSRAFEDFNRQQAQAFEDYQRDRGDRIDDFNRQIQESEDQAREQRRKNQEDFDKEDTRRQQDHLRDMIRAARDVDDAISGRNFLAAQQALQKIRDAEEDYRTDRARRLEDYQQQQKDLEDNLKEQEDKRAEDFQRQLQQMDDNFSRQQQRQQQEFAIRIQREEQDRALRLQREDLDRYIRRQREEQDFAIQLASLTAHNNTMQFIWQYGLGILEQLTSEFWSSFQQANIPAPLPAPSPAGSPENYSDYLRALTQMSATAQGYNYSAGIYPSTFTGTPFANEGIVMRTGLALAHQGEVIFNPAGRAPLGANWTPGGDVIIQVDARGSHWSEKEWIDAAEERIVPKVTEALEKLRRRVG